MQNKSLISSLLCVIFLFCLQADAAEDDSGTAVAMPDNLVSSGRAAVLLERDSLRVLYEKNAYEKRPMASTTKVMTAIVAIENGNLDDIVKVSEKAYGTEGSSIYLGLGEKAKLLDLLYGLMLQSGNDAAIAIAEHVGGSVEGFADMMNGKARELGAINTNFVNPHGLPNDDHYTTAYDLALISAYAMKNPVFREIVGTKEKRIPWADRGYSRVLKNKNKLLYQFPDATGIKTGFTKAAGRCLTFAAMRGDIEVVGAVLSCGDYFNDAAELMDAAFGVYAMETAFESGEILRVLPVENGQYDGVEVTVAGDLKGPMLPGEKVRVEMSLATERLKAPVAIGEKVGVATLYAGDIMIGTQPLVTAKEIGKAGFWKSMRRLIMNWPLFAGYY